MKYFTCLLALGALTTAALAVIDASFIDVLKQDLLQLEKDLIKDLADKQKWTNPLVEDQEKYLYLFKTYKTFGDKVDQLFPLNRENNLKALYNLLIWIRVETDAIDINGLYGIFREMQRRFVEFNRPIRIKQISNFAESTLWDPFLSVPRIFYRMSIMIDKEKLFMAALEEVSQQMCNKMIPPQQVLYDLYNTLALTEIKGYILMQFSYMLLRVYKDAKVNLIEEIQELIVQYESRTSRTLSAAKAAISLASRSLWRCDPITHISGGTYHEVEQGYHGYLVNEKYLHQGSCYRESCYCYCMNYTDTTLSDNDCKSEEEVCPYQRPCKGRIMNCELLGYYLYVCLADKSNRKNRYDYIQTENAFYGNKRSCTKNTIYTKSWLYYAFSCDWCFCYCNDHDPNRDRYFSLRSVMSDISNNRVITGIRLKKLGRIIHIQIQDGQLLPNGAINTSTAQWQPVRPFSIKDHDVKLDHDYHAVEWERRKLNLDDIIAPPGYLLTGIQFQGTGECMYLKIKATPFNFTSGLLIEPETKSSWYGNKLFHREELKYIEPDIPIRDSLKNVPDSKEGQYLNFRPTDPKKDAAESTIPFVDLQPIVPDSPTLIAGAGIFHKGQEGSGGFVAMKLIPYDFTLHMQVDMSSDGARNSK